MRFNWWYLLLLLLFAILIPTYLTWSEFKDLTANLLAALIVILVIDKIIEKSKLQKTERSVNYVKRRIASVCIDLIWRMQPPKDWQERLSKANSNWDDYYEKVWNLKENALHSLEMLLDRYHYLMDAELKNDVLEMVGLLDDPTRWMQADPSVAIERERLDLHLTAGNVTNVIVQSINTIKQHKLLNRKSLVITHRQGEPPKMTRVKLTDVGNQTERHYLYFEQFLKESIKFRDESFCSVCKD